MKNNELESRLTIEFLKKNNFDFDELENFWYYNDYVTPSHNWLEDDDDRTITFCVTDDNEFNLIIASCQKDLINTNIRYIHEFQQALRLTGLDMIANNFKF